VINLLDRQNTVARVINEETVEQYTNKAPYSTMDSKLESGNVKLMKITE